MVITSKSFQVLQFRNPQCCLGVLLLVPWLLLISSLFYYSNDFLVREPPPPRAALSPHLSKETPHLKGSPALFSASAKGQETAEFTASPASTDFYSIVPLPQNTSQKIQAQSQRVQADWSPLEASGLGIVTFATKVTPGFCRTARSLLFHNLTLFILGYGQNRSEYGVEEDIRSDKPYKFLEFAYQAQRRSQEWRAQKGADPVLIFMDGFDVLGQQNSSVILTKIQGFLEESRILYSAEKECWPYSMDPAFQDKTCVQSHFPSTPELEGMYRDSDPPGVTTRFLNSGWMACRSRDCARWFKDSLETRPTYFPEDDQSIAAMTCLRYGKDCRIDIYSTVIQSMHKSVQDMELLPLESDSRGLKMWRNKRTGSVPSFLHFNGNKDAYAGMDKYKALNLSSEQWIYTDRGSPKRLSFQKLCGPFLEEISH